LHGENSAKTGFCSAAAPVFSKRGAVLFLRGAALILCQAVLILRIARSSENLFATLAA